MDFLIGFFTFLSSGGPTKDIPNGLFPNVTTFIAHLIATGIILTVLVFLVWRPYKRFLERRNQEIHRQLDIAKNDKIRAIELREEASNDLVSAKVKAAQIISRAHEAANEERIIILTETKEKVRLYQENVRDEIDKQRVKEEQMLKRKIVDTAIEITQKALGEKLKNKTSSEKFVKNILKTKTTNETDNK